MTLSTKRVALGLLVVVVMSVAGTIGYAWHAGYRAYVVQTGSMMPTIHPGDAVLDRPSSRGYGIGDPVTVAIAPDVLVTHRLASVDKQGLLHTKGDANRAADAWKLQPTRVRGVVDRVLPKVGYLVVFMRQKEGIVGVMTSALSIFLLWGLCFPQEATEPRARARKLTVVPDEPLAA